MGKIPRVILPIISLGATGLAYRLVSGLEERISSYAIEGVGTVYRFVPDSNGGLVKNNGGGQLDELVLLAGGAITLYFLSRAVRDWIRQ